MSQHTVKEIAERAGVSPATVSRVVNGTGSVAPDKRERVLSVLEEWNEERPPRQAAGRKTKNICALLPTRPESDSNAVLRKLAALAGQMRPNWNLVLLPPGILPLELEARHLRGELAGLLLIGHTAESPELLQALRRIPHVWLNSHRGGGNSTVLMGNEFAGRIAARYLMDAGCGEFTVLSVPSLNPGLPGRISGFRFELFAAEKSCETIELALPPGRNGLEECTDEELEQSLENVLPSLKNGLFSPEERLTALLYRAFARRKAGPPPLLVSCNHTAEYLAGLYPRPATIDLGPRMLAELALKELLRRISGEAPRADHIAVIVTPQLVPGDPL